MSVRFRIRTSQGQEVSFASHEMFAEFVRSGDLSPDDVVYDAETREWSSAMTHPVVLEISAEDEQADDHPAEGDPEVAETAETIAEGSPEPTTAAEGEPASTSDLNIGLDLAPAPSPLTPEQASEAFVKKMKAERASSFDFDEEQAAQGIKMEQGSSGLVRGIVDAPEETAPEPAPPKRRDPSFDKPPPRPPQPQPPKRPKSGVGRRYAPLLIVGAVVLAAGVYFGPELLAPGTGQGAEAGTDSLTLPPPPPR